MAFDKTNTGTLTKNVNKKDPSHSDYTGSIHINGVEHWFNANVKEGKYGKFLSCRIGKPKEPKDNFKPRGDDEMPKSSGIQDDDMAIPF